MNATHQTFGKIGFLVSSTVLAHFGVVINPFFPDFKTYLEIELHYNEKNIPTNLLLQLLNFGFAQLQ